MTDCLCIAEDYSKVDDLVYLLFDLCTLLTLDSQMQRFV
jgi:hypothetical protein